MTRRLSAGLIALSLAVLGGQPDARADTFTQAVMNTCKVGDVLNGKPGGYTLGAAREEVLKIARRRQPGVVSENLGVWLRYPKPEGGHSYTMIRSWDQLAATERTDGEEQLMLRVRPALCLFHVRYRVLVFREGVLNAVREDYLYDGP